MIEVKEINKSRIKDFLKLPYRLYKNDNNWVPPLYSGMKGTLLGVENEMFEKAPHTMFLSYRGKKVTARVLCGMNPTLILEKGKKTGYFSLFEAEDEESGKQIMNAAEKWCKNNGAELIIGPWSPDDGEGWRGLLISGFDGPPILMNAYTKKWYPEFLEKLGYIKHHDIYALRLKVDDVLGEKLRILAEVSIDKYGYEVRSVDMSRLNEEAKDFYKILVNAYPPEWESTLPSYEFVLNFISSIKSIVDPDIIAIVRIAQTREPVAFVVALPDYNQVIKKMNGKMLPFGFITFLTQRKKIDQLRILQQFCIPEYRSKGAILTAYYNIYKNAVGKNYKMGEASTIDEENFHSWKPVQGIGGEVYRTYRYYYKSLNI